MKKKLIATAIVMLSTILSYAQTKQPVRSLKETILVEDLNDKINIIFNEKGSYQIFEGTYYKKINWNKPVANTSKNQVIIEKNGVRPYFGIVKNNKDTIISTSRYLPFLEVSNMRDIGGLKTKDNRIVVWGKIFRSDAISKLKPSEYEKFKALNIENIYDLRTKAEIDKEPNPVFEGVVNTHLPIIQNLDNTEFIEIEKKIKEGTMKPEYFEQLLYNAYNRFVSDECIEPFKNLVHQVLDSEGSTLYHCMAGMDRTGFATALILSVLNVDRETIFEEYEMSNYYTLRKKATSKKHEELSPIEKYLQQPEVQKSFIGGDRTLLKANFKIIDEKYNGIDNFIKNQLQISDSERENWINKYTK